MKIFKINIVCRTFISSFIILIELYHILKRFGKININNFKLEFSRDIINFF